MASPWEAKIERIRAAHQLADAKAWPNSTAAHFDTLFLLGVIDVQREIIELREEA